MNDSNEKERFTHPSFGQISFSRVQSNGTDFYGSEIKQDNYITMEVCKSEIERTLSQDWYFAHELPLIRIRMSAMQFSEAITSMNMGSGICCTVEMVNQKPMDKLPYQESRKDFIHRKFSDRMAEFAKTLKEKQNRVKELTAKKALSKADQQELNFLVEWLTQEVASNIPFFARCFQETMDEVVLEAKTEVENAIQHKINTLGLAALHQEQNILKEKTGG